MAAIQFTRNHTDHSTDKGFQFEFFCDRCGNGFMSEFRANATGIAVGALKAAGDIFGGLFSQASREVTRFSGLFWGLSMTRRSATRLMKSRFTSGSVRNARHGHVPVPAGMRDAAFATIARQMWKPNWPPLRHRRLSNRCGKKFKKLI